VRRRIVKLLFCSPLAVIACKRPVAQSARVFTAPAAGCEETAADGCGQKKPLDPPAGRSSISAGEGSGALSTALSGCKIAIDVGHSPRGDDLGAFAGSISEHKLNKLEAERVRLGLLRHGAKLVTLNFYPDSTSVPLAKRGQDAAGHNIFISIHHNAGPASVQGTEVLVDSQSHSRHDQRLAGHLQRELLKALGLTDRGTKAQGLSVLRHAPSTVEAVALTEAFFISHHKLTLEQAQAWVEPAAEAIVNGIVAYWSQKSSPTLSLAAVDGGFEPWPEADDPYGLYVGH
jgi:N-acetylmuramoyl-L-alanine amidase